MAVIDFGGVKEKVVKRKEFPVSRARRVLKGETIAIIGYGVQGPAQALNLKDNGFKVIIGQAKAFKKDWNRAKRDGWVPGKTLFDIEEAAQKGEIQCAALWAIAGRLGKKRKEVSGACETLNLKIRKCQLGAF